MRALVGAICVTRLLVDVVSLGARGDNVVVAFLLLLCLHLEQGDHQLSCRRCGLFV